MNTQLLIIDPQNDFCDLPASWLPSVDGQAIAPALPVAGAHDDMLGLARFIDAAGELISGITVTLDSHPYVAIERTTFWVNELGQEVAPFTEITAQDVKAGRYRPVHGDRIEPISGKPLNERVIELLTRLEQAGRYRLMAWPVHCVTGSWGANIHAAVSKAINEWEFKTAAQVRKVLKGEYALAEQYGAFEAETPIDEVPGTRFNSPLAANLTDGVDRLLVAGEASSHCVEASIEQLIKYRKGDGSNIVLLIDCMSPVTGFKEQEQDFYERAQAAGMTLATWTQIEQQIKA